MHRSSMKTGEDFFDVYAKELDSGIVLDIGSQDVNGSLSEVCPKKLTYTGVDFIEGKGVDLVLKDPYALPFPDNYADMIVSSSCFEHSEMFWLLFLEIMRVLKPSGLFYMNVPSNGLFHRYPVDCWRFYPDSGKALATWGNHNKIDVCLLESFTSAQDADIWNDYAAVFLKDRSKAHLYPSRISDSRNDIENVCRDDRAELKNLQTHPQTLRSLEKLEYDHFAIHTVAKQLVFLLFKRLMKLVSTLGTRLRSIFRSA